jgi:hypothetical protein
MTRARRGRAYDIVGEKLPLTMHTSAHVALVDRCGATKIAARNSMPKRDRFEAVASARFYTTNTEGGYSSHEPRD